MIRPARPRVPVAAALLVLAAVPSASAAALPKALTQSHPQFAVRPAQIGYTGDSSGLVGGPKTAGARYGRISWTSWTTRSARGRGVVWLNDCTPNCAAGRFGAHRATIALTRPSGGRLTRLTLHFTLGGRRVTDVRRAVRHGGVWSYEIVRQAGR